MSGAADTPFGGPQGVPPGPVRSAGFNKPANSHPVPGQTVQALGTRRLGAEERQTLNVQRRIEVTGSLCPPLALLFISIRNTKVKVVGSLVRNTLSALDDFFLLTSLELITVLNSVDV